MKRLFILISIFAAQSFFAQNFELSALKAQKRYADSLFAAGNYYRAITEYKRLEFFDGNKTFAYDAALQIAAAYKRGGFFERAETYFNKAIETAPDATKRLRAETELVKNYIISRQTDRALNFLDKLENAGESESTINYWRGWAYLFSGKTNLSAYHFARSGKADSLAAAVRAYGDSLFSVSTAKTLSYIIPGAGQIYLGEYFSGAMSFLWNALWIYVTANAFSDGRIIEGFLVGDLLWLRFYRGNIQNAERFAKEKNVKLLNGLLINLQKHYRGEKP